MLRVNQYKKVCYLTDSEKCQISDFFKNLFDVDNITQICVYLDEGNVVCNIEGFDSPFTSTIGSMIQHDVDVEQEIASAEQFRAFADAYNKKYYAKED